MLLRHLLAILALPFVVVVLVPRVMLVRMQELAAAAETLESA
jgi:hypothetical protein